jgi:hypothetical protein
MDEIKLDINAKKCFLAEWNERSGRRDDSNFEEKQKIFIGYTLNQIENKIKKMRKDPRFEMDTWCYISDVKITEIDKNIFHYYAK